MLRWPAAEHRPSRGRGRPQVLVYHDLLGMMQHPHHAKVTPKFCKQFAAVGVEIQGGLQRYREEARGRRRGAIG